MERLFSIAVNTGGTFTDIALVDRRTGKLFKAKTPSTPEDPSLGFVTVMQRILAETGMRAQDISHVFHGTTVTTNTILEMDDAECALLTTTGFRYVEIGRLDIPRNENIYSWVRLTRPIPAERICEVDGRMDFEGHEQAPLCEEQIRDAIACIMKRNIKAIAMCCAICILTPMPAMSSGPTILSRKRTRRCWSPCHLKSCPPFGNSSEA